jgi:hypothetical protein
MNENNSLLLDVINILPDGIDCYIQAPSLEDKTILGLMSLTEHAYYKSVKLEGNNKKVFLQQVKEHPIEEYFQSIEIKFDGKLLFVGYDGIEFGIISNTIKLPEWFVDKYVKAEMCNISNEW